jgi:hypothetical protein
LRPGLEIVTSLPRDRACKILSCALSQRGSANLRHRWIFPRNAGNGVPNAWMQRSQAEQMLF